MSKNTDYQPENLEGLAMESLVEDLDETTTVYGPFEDIPRGGEKVIQMAADVFPFGYNGDGRYRLCDILNDSPFPSLAFPPWVHKLFKTQKAVPHFNGDQRFNLFFFLCFNGVSPDRAAAIVWSTSVNLYRVGTKKVLKCISSGYDNDAVRHHDQVLKDWLSGKMMETAAKQKSFIHGTDPKVPILGKQVKDLTSGTVVNVGHPPFQDYDDALHIYMMTHFRGLRDLVSPMGHDLEMHKAFSNFICHPEFPRKMAERLANKDSTRDIGLSLHIAGQRASSLLDAVQRTMLPGELAMLARVQVGTTLDTKEIAERITVLAEVNERAKKLIRQNRELMDLISMKDDDLLAFFETGAALPWAEHDVLENHVPGASPDSSSSNDPFDSGESEDEEEEEESVEVVEDEPPKKKRKFRSEDD